MDHVGQNPWLKDVLVFLLAGGIIVPLLRLVRLPSVLAFLLAGVALGPQGMGALDDRWPALEYLTISDAHAIAPFAELGVLFLLFLLGLELSFEKLWSLRRSVFGAGSLQTGLSAAAIGLASYLLGLPAPAAVAVGLALALSSTAIVMQILTEERRAAGPVGRTALSVLLFQDMLVVPILILISFLSQDGQANLPTVIVEALLQGALALVAVALIGRFLLRDAFRLAASSGGRDLLMALTLLTVVGGSLITAGAGLSLALGAFLAGLLLGETEFKHLIQVDIEPFKGLLLGLFFMTVGMGLDLASVWHFLPAVLLGLAGLLAAKGLIAALACRVFAGDTALAIENGFLLAPAGEFAFVVVATALTGGLLAREAASQVAAVACLSMLLAPGLARLGRIAAKRVMERASDASQPADFSELKGHVVMAGFGRVGRAIARILTSEEAEVVALDWDPELVARERREGWRVFLGDASRPELLERTGSAGAALFIVTVDDPASAEAMVRAVRVIRPDLPILVRARDAEHARRLSLAGASFVVPDAIEAGLQLAGRALHEFGYAGETVSDRIAAEREAEYRRATAD